MPRHPNKEFDAAWRYAESRGWTVIRSKKGHCWGIIRCAHGRGGCQKSIWSTPRVPQDHADAIPPFVDRCPH
ncbi:MAG: hypothetical protein B7Z74_00115 [Deltaproteobacteria bacterium 21-66-5]|nr:MAG: hypothetical protein B7Z74_00115 [Deltaproteobacteria bacterium 21-66-5]